MPRTTATDDDKCTVCIFSIQQKTVLYLDECAQGVQQCIIVIPETLNRTQNVNIVTRHTLYIIKQIKETNNWVN